MISLSRLGASAVLLGITIAATAEDPSYPAAPRRPVTEAYQGVTVSEDYRWLEGVGAPVVQGWIGQQNALTRRTIDAIAGRPAIERELELLGQAPLTRGDLRYATLRCYC